MKPHKPLQGKAYGSIPHLPGSKFGKDDKGCPPGEAKYFTDKKRNKYDNIIVTEKLDGSCVGVTKIDDKIIPIIRAGYPCITSPFYQHVMFHNWVTTVFGEILVNHLDNYDWIMGEWLAQAHGTKYNLDFCSPWPVFDWFKKGNRQPYKDLINLCDKTGLWHVPILHQGDVLPIDAALSLLGENGKYGALELAEGCVWRAECPDGKVYLAKFVRGEKEVGKYLGDWIDGNWVQKEPIWNWEYKPKGD